MSTTEIFGGNSSKTATPSREKVALEDALCLKRVATIVNSVLTDKLSGKRERERERERGRWTVTCPEMVFKCLSISILVQKQVKKSIRGI